MSNVTWTDVVAVDTTNGDLTKTGGAGWNAGAVTTQTLAQDGYVEFTTDETTTYKFAGLSRGDSNQDFSDIDFAFYLSGAGTVSVYEDGALIKTIGTYAAGDLFRVESTSGQVTYEQNGSAVYTSAKLSLSPLLVDTSLYSTGATLANVNLIDVPRFWQKPQNVMISDTGVSITSTGGSNWASGASSVVDVVGSGYVEFSTAESNTYKMAGLTQQSDLTTYYTNIDWAFYLAGDSSLLICEAGQILGTFGSYAPNDVFRVQVVDGVVTYHQNGALLYTSAKKPSGPVQQPLLHLDTSLLAPGATITNGFVSSFWNNSVNVTLNGPSVTKTGIADWNGGASSIETCEGDCYVEFTTAETTTYKMAGLGHADTGQGYAEIDFAFYLAAGGTLLIYEDGAPIGSFGSYSPLDDFRIQEVDGQVEYFQNSVLLYTSTKPATFPLLLDTSLYSPGATIQNAVIGAVYWQNPVNVTISGNSLTKAGGDGWNGGASTAASVPEGAAEFTTGEATTYKMAGLSNGDSDAGYGDIDYAVYFAAAGQLFIFEQGNEIGSFGTYRSGDVFRVQAGEDEVSYFKNGSLLYTSLTTPVFPIRIDTSLYTHGATIKNATLTTGWFWRNQVGVNATNRDLTKVGANSAWDAGASSSKSIGGDGYVEFSTLEAITDKMVGLSNGDGGADYSDIDFGIYLSSQGLVNIYENAVFIGTLSTYVPGDIFRVAVSGPQVTYLKNGAVLYSSSKVPTFPLLVDTSLFTPGATIVDANLVAD